MKAKLLVLVSSLFLVTFIVGCAGNGLYLSSNQTLVNLEESNYRIVATNVSGQSTAGYLLGVSWSLGAVTESLALLRVAGPGPQYQAALDELWENFEQQHGSVEGRSLGLVNVRYDADVLNTILYTESTVYVTADVVEFY